METDKKLTPAELEELNNFLLFANAGFTIIGTMDLHWAEGFLCGICSAPIPLLPSQWQPLLFPEEGFEFKTEEEAKGIISLVLRHYNMVDRILHKDRFEPIYEWHKFNVSGTKRRAHPEMVQGVTYMASRNHLILSMWE